MASLAYLVIVLCLCLHACTARPLGATQPQLSSKDVNTSVPERFVKHGDKGSDHRLNILQSDNHKFSSVEEAAENIEGKKIKTSLSLRQATVLEILKRAERSMMESRASNAEEKVNSKDNNTMDDIVVMDYAQPHRKPPIHNKGT